VTALLFFASFTGYFNKFNKNKKKIRVWKDPWRWGR